MSLSVVRRTQVSVSLEPAANNIPWDSIPLNVLGSRFAMIIIFLFWSSSFV